MGMVQNLIDYHIAKGRKADCAMILWLQDHQTRISKLSGAKLEAAEDAVRTLLFSRPEWKALHSYEALQVTNTYPEPRKTRVQTLYLDHIISKMVSEPDVVVGLLRALAPSKTRPAFFSDATLNQKVAAALPPRPPLNTAISPVSDVPLEG